MLFYFQMKNKYFYLICFCLGFGQLMGQSNYTSYFTGNPADVEASPLGGAVLMGGAGENDEAMTWFLNRADGGDILVLRASGADGYNDYLYSELGVSVNSVETIVFNDWTAASEPYILDKIARAEAIWFAGGDQWDYVSYWRGTAVATSINEAVEFRGAVIGGISAGMAIMGSIYFTAENGTVTSTQALNNPYHPNITLSGAPFLDVPYMTNVITDTHYDDPDRKGRHTVFLARTLVDAGVNARGIACDEFTAVCIAPDGIARIYGEYPSFDDNVYFLHTNCNDDGIGPEIMSNGSPMTWDVGGEALYVYQVKGTTTGENTFDLNDWKSGTGGEWKAWSVESGVFSEADSGEPACNPLSTDEFELAGITMYPNPAIDQVTLNWDNGSLQTLSVYSINGQKIAQYTANGVNQIQFSTSGWASGVYFVRAVSTTGEVFIQKLLKS